MLALLPVPARRVSPPPFIMSFEVEWGCCQPLTWLTVQRASLYKTSLNAIVYRSVRFLKTIIYL